MMVTRNCKESRISGPAKLKGGGKCGLVPADDPLAREAIQALASVFAHDQRFTELQPHLFVLRDDVRLDDDDHIFSEYDFPSFMARRCARLENRRILVGAVDQVVVDCISPAVDNLSGLFGFPGRSSIFDD